MSKITIRCDGIMCDSKIDIDVPDWSGNTEYGGDSSYTFCPKCNDQRDFFRCQCPGCIDSFPGCGLGKAYAYTNSPGLLQKEKEVLLTGKCPYRVGGTYLVFPEGGLMRHDLSGPPESIAGKAIVEAIDAYQKKYPGEERK